MNEPRSPWRDRGAIAFVLLAIVLGLFLIRASENLIFQNDGDFRRTSEFMLERATHALETTGEFRKDGFTAPEEFSPAAYAFLAFGWVQRFFSTQYHLSVSSVTGKVVVLAGLALFAAIAVGPRNPLLRAGVFIILALCAFAAHNAAVLKSFYLDYTFFLALPFLLAGFVARDGKWRTAALTLGSLLAGLSKIQFFYVPLLVLCSLFVMRQRGDRLPRATVFALLLAQLLCVAPALDNPHRHLNYYHATFFGTYLVMTPAELDSLHLSPKERNCVGVDAGGNGGRGPGATDVHPGGITCVTDKPPSIRRVLEPYLKYPSTFARLLAFAMPAHFTVDYFHVYPDFKLLMVLDRSPRFGQSFLLKLTEYRERWITPSAPVWIVLAMALAIYEASRRSRYGPMLFFLAGFTVSQVVVCLVGEGVRDLSRHLWAAQLALDFLVVILVLRIACIAACRGRASEP